MKRHTLYVAVLLGLIITDRQAAGEEDHKCSHCLATAEVLARRIASEKPRNHLDFRGRLDGDGTRYGKILDFRLSELRIVELLDDLSSDLNTYVQVDINNITRWQPEKLRQGELAFADELERQHWRRQLKRWCEQAIERHEDAITRYLRSEAVSQGGIQDLLCGRLTRVCQVEDMQKEEL